MIDVATVPYYLDPPMRELRDALTAWLAAETAGWFEVRRQADRGGL